MRTRGALAIVCAASLAGAAVRWTAKTPLRYQPTLLGIELIETLPPFVII
jgi:hypothetical protein